MSNDRAGESANKVPEDGGAFSIEEFCEWSGIGRTAVYEEINSGRLRAKKRGTRTLIPRRCAHDWLESLPEMGSAAA
jgi:excisionase family DNA binding protein